jgi:hypothetical protein
MLLAAACGDPSDDAMGMEPDSGIFPSEGEADTSGASSGASGGGDDGPKLDAPPDEVTDGGSAEGGDTACEKVDILFVIDNSGSMADEQVKLVNNFPVFAQEIQTTLSEVNDYHVGVTSTDNYGLALFSPGINSDSPECRLLGSLITSTNSGDCAPYVEGGRYMTEQDDLQSKFSCAGNLGDTGSGLEQVAGAMTAAISPALNSPGACNEGFIRDDALLVVVLISDENDDIESMGDPADWYSLVSSFKFNEPDNVVVLSLIWDDSNGNPNGCVNATDEEIGSDLIAFTQMFTYGSVGSVCVDSYQTFFHDAISVIDSACDDFMPPG